MSVEVESLLDASARLESTRITMEDLAGRNALWTDVDAGAAGSAEAAEAVRSFLNRWSYGLSCLRSDIASLAKGLQRAAEAYEEVEAEIVAAAGG